MSFKQTVQFNLKTGNRAEIFRKVWVAELPLVIDHYDKTSGDAVCSFDFPLDNFLTQIYYYPSEEGLSNEEHLMEVIRFYRPDIYNVLDGNAFDCRLPNMSITMTLDFLRDNWEKKFPSEQG